MWIFYCKMADAYTYYIQNQTKINRNRWQKTESHRKWICCHSNCECIAKWDQQYCSTYCLAYFSCKYVLCIIGFVSPPACLLDCLQTTTWISINHFAKDNCMDTYVRERDRGGGKESTSYPTPNESYWMHHLQFATWNLCIYINVHILCRGFWVKNCCHHSRDSTHHF